MSFGFSTGSEAQITVREIPVEEGALFEKQERGLEPDIKNMVIYGAYQESLLVGVCRINRFPVGFDGVAISYFGILPDKRKMGIGSRLLEFICEKYTHITATTGHRSDPGMGKLLLRYGFKERYAQHGIRYWDKTS